MPIRYLKLCTTNQRKLACSWPTIIIFVQITPPAANLQSLRLTSSCKDRAVAKYCHMEISLWLLPYQFFYLPCPLSMFHTHKAPSHFSKHNGRPGLLSCWHPQVKLNARGPTKLRAHQIFTCLPNLLHKMWWDLFNPLHNGFPSFHNSTLDSKSGLGNLGV